jgi:Protein of unknown function (DUF3313)
VRNRTLSLLVPVIVLLVFVASTPVSSANQDQSAVQGSGFLADYSKLQQDPHNSDLLIHWNDPGILKNSSKFILDPVVVYLLPEAQQRGIDPEDLAKLAKYFTRAITEELTKSGKYQVLTKPGPGVMELKLAITNVEPINKKENVAEAGATLAAPPGTSLIVPRLSVGKVSIEGELVDSVSGQVKVEFMSSKRGGRFFSGLKAFQKWGDIDAAFRAWAKNFRERLDKAHEA